MRRAIRLLVLLAIVGAVCIASSQTRGPQWTVHCEMACTGGCEMPSCRCEAVKR
jgi:hypothetical protein